MKPRLLNLAAGVSLLLAIVIVVLWVRSYARHEVIARHWHTNTEERAWIVESRYNSLAFRFTHLLHTGPVEIPSYMYYDLTRDDSAKRRLQLSILFPPVQFAHDSGPNGSYDAVALAIAYWLLLLPTLPLPLIALARHRRRRRRETNNLCPTCGYDLRATPDRCPECGRAIFTTPAR